MRKEILIAVSVLIFTFCLFASQDTFANSKTEYRLQPTDVLTITVHGQPDLTTKTRITKKGYITFPLIGKMKVKGLTAQELEQELKAMLEADYLVSAQVLVFIEEYHPRQISVIGEVEKPGKYEMPTEKQTTLLEAIAMAGGFSKHANMNATRIIRVKDGKKENITVRVEDIIEKGEKDQDIILEPDDIVSVSESVF